MDKPASQALVPAMAAIFVFVFLVWRALKLCQSCVRRIMKVLVGKEARASPRLQMEYNTPGCRPMYPAGFCTSCRTATHCPWHCRGCGSHTNNASGGGRVLTRALAFAVSAEIINRVHLACVVFLLPRRAAITWSSFVLSGESTLPLRGECGFKPVRPVGHRASCPGFSWVAPASAAAI